MDQKIEYDFRLEKRLHLINVGQLFRALFTFKYSAIFSNQKSVPDFSCKTFDSRSFIFKP